MIDRERCFRMSAIHALNRLRSFARDRPAVDLDRLATALRCGTASEATFDYDQAVTLMRQCPAVANLDPSSGLDGWRSLLKTLILEVEPAWKWLIPLGRGHLAQYLSIDAKQVFDGAGLYSPADNADVRAWWDGIAQAIRGLSADARLHIGRRGEELTIAHERAVLLAAGRNDLVPEFIGFEDNTRGYDVRSYIVAVGSDRPKYIEVKATESHPLRFFLSRNEWKTAETYANDYFVHLWHLPSETLFEISFTALSVHVPLDQGWGEWDTAVISWR